MSSTKANRVMRYISSTFDAATEASAARNHAEFTELAIQHAALVDLYRHLCNGGLIN